MLHPQRKFYRWGPIEACPLFMYFTIETAFAPLKKLFGITYSESLIIFKDSKVTWLLDEEDLLVESKKFVDKNILIEQNFKRYRKLWEKRSDQLESLFKNLETIQLSSLSNSNLKKIFAEFIKKYSDWFTITISHELATSSLEPLLKSHLKHYFHDSEEYQNAFSTLTSPETLTFYRQQEKDLMQILLKGTNLENKLKEHQKKYFWIYNSYAKGQVLDLDYFKEQMENLASTNYKEKLNDILNYQKNIRSKKEYIKSKFKLKKDDIHLSDLVSLFARLLDERKMLNFKAEHYLELFVQEYSKRTNLPSDDLKLLLPHELLQVFHSFDKVTIQKRKECFVLSCNENEIVQFTDKQALSISEEFTNVPMVKNKIIEGTVASRGNVRHFRGVARVILNINQIGQIKPGEILITQMTSPDFVVGMKKAGAVITDIGGILSHAAIVSREFGIPCIVGTEIATKMIHDGDIVELHCVKGVVRIIQS